MTNDHHWCTCGISSEKARRDLWSHCIKTSITPELSLRFQHDEWKLLFVHKVYSLRNLHVQVGFGVVLIYTHSLQNSPCLLSAYSVLTNRAVGYCTQLVHCSNIEVKELKKLYRLSAEKSSRALEPLCTCTCMNEWQFSGGACWSGLSARPLIKSCHWQG